MLKKIVKILLLGIMTSFFFYPVSFKGIPLPNTKNMFAALGIFLLLYNMVRHGKANIKKGVITSFLWAVLFSIMCYVSVTLNDTHDLTYVTYFRSFLIWTLGAYSVCYFMRIGYGKVDLKTITYYLAGVAVFQVLIAQLIDTNFQVQMFVDRYFDQDQMNIRSMKRLYGIGASLDSAGVRFAITEIMMSFFIVENSKKSGRNWETILLFIAFIVILVFGNMIARTTTVGALVGLAYMIYDNFTHIGQTVKVSKLQSSFIIIMLIVIAIPVFIFIYTTNIDLQHNFRFAFEGFFNWAETGRFYTSSTDKLNGTMWIWPHDERTWWIGSGLIDNWVYGTDIGYCRFILYCGILGFSVFVIFFIHNAVFVSKMYKGCGMLPVLLMALSLIVWVKVSTDIYQIYALLFCADGLIRYERPPEVETTAKK